MTDEIPFTDLIRRTPDGGIVITIDHPAGPLEWQLPAERAEEFFATLMAEMQMARFERLLRARDEHADSVRKAEESRSHIAELMRLHRITHGR